MKTSRDIKREVDSTISAMDTIESVKISSFFKDKTMQRLFSEEEEEEEEEERQMVWSWFTTRVQLATLACVVVLNIIALTKLRETSYSDSVSQFAESYGLSTTTETSLLN